jgi:hypothetical protein
MSSFSVNFEFLNKHARLLTYSYTKLTGKHLVDPATVEASVSPAEALFNAPFALVSHNGAPDPVFNFGNKTALSLFEMTWEEFTKLPSRFSAEPENRDARAELLLQVSTKGFIDNYSGIRISKTGRRFEINAATVWNLIDENLQVKGQAAMFNSWKFL